MAGNPSQQDKMAVYNSSETRQDTSSRNDTGMDELSVGVPRALQKTKSMEGHNKKKSSFQITSVVDRSGHLDGVDDLDDTCETHTEDVSSDILDLSKNTDIEPEPSSEETTPSFYNDDRDGGFSFNRDTNQVQHSIAPPQQLPAEANKASDMQSRFKVVKIESKEPFKRGRWTCLDYLDPLAEKSNERTDKSDNKSVDEVGSGNSSASSSIHYVHGVDDPAKNPLASVVLPDVHQVAEPQPVYPSSTQGQNGEYQPYSQTVGVAATGNQPRATEYQQDPVQASQNASYDLGQAYDVTLTGQQGLANQTLQQASQQSHIAGGVLGNTQTTGVPVPVPHQSVPLQPGQSSLPTADPALDYSNQTNYGGEYIPKPGDVSQPQSQVPTQSSVNQVQNVVGISHGTAASTGQGNSAKNSPNAETLQGQDVLGKDITTYSSSVEDKPKVRHEAANESENESDEGAAAAAAVAVTAASSQAARQANGQSYLSPPLLEMVSLAMQPNSAVKENTDDRFLLNNVFSGASTVAIDNKIEQAMDLVKSHLMFAVREEVEVLKEQIKELLEKNSQLEYENSILKAAATPDTLSQLQSQPPTSNS